MEEQMILQNILCYKENRENFSALTEIYQRNACVPFIGAGLSADFSYKMWREFLISVSSGNAEIENLLNQFQYEEAAELLYDRDSDCFERMLQKEYWERKLEQETFVQSSAALLPQMFNGPIITTNFDRVIEYAYMEYGSPLERISILEEDAFYSSLASRKRCLFKIHGDVEDLSNIVITKKQYDDRYSCNKKYLDHFTIFIKTNIFLFLGCSLNQDRTVSLMANALNGLKGNYHYAFIASPALTHFGAADEGQLQQEEAIRTRLERFHIRPIWYPEGEHSYVRKFLEVLSKMGHRRSAVERGNLYIAQLKSRYESVDGVQNYVAPTICDFSTGEESQNLDLFQLLARHRVVVITGAAGSGKTTILQKFVLEALSIYMQLPNELLPVYVDLSQWQDDDFSSFLQKTWSDIWLMHEDILEVLHEKKAILFLDSFNQMKGSIENKAHYLQQWIQNNSDLLIVIASRKLEYEMYAGALDAYYRIELSALDDDKRYKFIMKYLPTDGRIFEQQLKRISKLELLKRDWSDEGAAMTDIFRNIKENPFFLKAMICYFKENDSKLSCNPFEVFDAFVKHSLGTYTVPAEYHKITYECMEAKLATLAFTMLNEMELDTTQAYIDYNRACQIVGKGPLHLAFYTELLVFTNDIVSFKQQMVMEYFAAIKLRRQKKLLAEVVPAPRRIFLDYASKSTDYTWINHYEDCKVKWQISVFFCLSSCLPEKQGLINMLQEIIKINPFVAIRFLERAEFIEEEITSQIVRQLIDEYADCRQLLDKLVPLASLDDFQEKIDIRSERFDPKPAVIIAIANNFSCNGEIIDLLFEVLRYSERIYSARGYINMDRDNEIEMNVRVIYALGKIGNMNVFPFLMDKLDDQRQRRCSSFANLNKVCTEAFLALEKIAKREGSKATEYFVSYYDANWKYHVEILQLLDSYASVVDFQFYNRASHDSSPEVRGTALKVMVSKFGNNNQYRTAILERLRWALYDEDSYVERKCDMSWEMERYTYPRRKVIARQALKYLEKDFQESFSKRDKDYGQVCRIKKQYEDAF